MDESANGASEPSAAAPNEATKAAPSAADATKAAPNEATKAAPNAADATKAAPNADATKAPPTATSANDRPLSVPPGILAIVAIMILGFALLPRLFKAREAALVGKPAPDFTLKVLMNDPTGGKPALTLSELRGQAVVLDFWASWCGPCQAEAPLVNRVAQRYKDRGLVVVGVNTSDTEMKGRAWAAQRGLVFPIVSDSADVAAHAYGVENLPTLVVVSRSGNVIAVRTGMTDDAELDALVKQAL